MLTQYPTKTLRSDLFFLSVANADICNLLKFVTIMLRGTLTDNNLNAQENHILNSAKM